MLTLGMQGRKWQIFISAVNLFSEHGYENISTRDIAAANDMGVASLYNHFQSKESLLHHIYRFYRENVVGVAPDLDVLLTLASEKSPREILHAAMSYYGEELQPIMDRIALIAIMRAHRDPGAYEIIWKYNVERSKRFLRAVLQKMLELNRIEPLDIESFLELFISFAFTAIFRNPSPDALGMEGWSRGLDLLFSLVKETPNAECSPL